MFVHFFVLPTTRFFLASAITRLQLHTRRCCTGKEQAADINNSNNNLMPVYCTHETERSNHKANKLVRTILFKIKIWYIEII